MGSIYAILQTFLIRVQRPMETLSRRESGGPVLVENLWGELDGNNGPQLCFHFLFLLLSLRACTGKTRQDRAVGS